MGKKVDILTREEVLTIYQGSNDLRTLTILLLGVGCGMRIGDILKLRVCDVKRPVIKITNKSGACYLYHLAADTFVKNTLKQVIDKRRDDEPLLIGKNGKVLSRFQAARLVKKVVKRVGIKKNISTQSFRKTYARWWYYRYNDVRDIKRKLGFTSTTAFLKYIEVDRLNYHRKRHKKESEPLIIPTFLDFMKNDI